MYRLITSRNKIPECWFCGVWVGVCLMWIKCCTWLWHSQHQRSLPKIGAFALLYFFNYVSTSYSFCRLCSIRQMTPLLSNRCWLLLLYVPGVLACRPTVFYADCHVRSNFVQKPNWLKIHSYWNVMTLLHLLQGFFPKNISRFDSFLNQKKFLQGLWILLG